MDRDVGCPLCEEYEGTPRQVEAHISSKADDAHQGESGVEYREELLERRDAAEEAAMGGESDPEADGGGPEESAGAAAEADADGETDAPADVQGVLEATEEEPPTGEVGEAAPDEPAEADDDGGDGAMVGALLLLVFVIYVIGNGEVELPSFGELLGMAGLVQEDGSSVGGSDGVFAP